MSRFALSPRSAAFAAFRAGSLVSVCLRPSSRSFSGAVLVASFRSAPAAGVFARRCAARCGVACAVRGSAGSWSVSVPVALSSSRWPAGAGWAWPVAGGLRGFLAVLGASGVGVCRG